MRRYIPVLLTLLLFSCSNDPDTYTLDGTASGFDDGTQVFVYEVVDANQPVIVDTIQIENGTFTAEYPKTDVVAIRYLSVQNPQGTVVFIPENENLKATLYKDSMFASSVSGGKENLALSDLNRKLRMFQNRKRDVGQRFRQARQEQDQMLASELQKENISLNQQEAIAKKQYIKENTNTLFALMLTSEMLSKRELTATEANEVVESLSPKMAETQMAKKITSALASLSKGEVGSKAPDFTAPDPNGNMLSLKETLGKYTLVDFWASWCKPCRMENPNVVRVYNKYHDKGLNIISVSLDRANQKDRWLKAIADDQMDWYHVSNLQFWQDPIAKDYNVRSIPATFLLDENGTIIAKNLRGAQLETQMAALLGP
ncbi:TlpA disulfide reductase family protein [Constantimarinum furrinae]|nr:TlpA disulfide reductase family protein [Constantimarinum furrinae]